MKKVKLPIELVPKSSHYNNLRKILKASQWKKLREIIIPPLSNKCQICGTNKSKRSLDLHEVWSYDINTGIQKLERLEGLCLHCHEVKHFYFAKLQGNEKRARERLKKINNFSEEELYEYELETHLNYLKRSQFEWTLDINLINNYLEKPI